MLERQLTEAPSISEISDSNATSRAFAEAMKAIEAISCRDGLPSYARLILEMRMKEFDEYSRLYRKPIEIETPNDLNVESSRQIYNYVDRGFHHIVGLTKEEYVNSFPILQAPPDKFKSLKLNLPIMVDPRIPIETYAAPPPGSKIKEEGFLYTIGSATLSNVNGGHKFPYYCWVQDGSKYRGVNWKAQEVVDQLEKPETEVILLEALSAIIMFPEMIRNGQIDVTGSRINGRVINLSQQGRTSILYSNGDSNPDVGVLTKGEFTKEKAPVFL